MRGLGEKMPLLLGCYTVASLALVGIPPMSGFVSKWYLSLGALASGTGTWAWMGPVVLLVSALLTAGYLLPLTIQGFFPGAEAGKEENGEKIPEGLTGQTGKIRISAWMMVPVFVLALGALWFGCFPGALIAMLEKIASGVL